MAADAPHPAFEGYAAEAVPQAAVGSPGKDGVLELGFAAGSDGTDLVLDHATAPFHVPGTLDHDPHPDVTTVFVQSPTGVVTQGDRHEVGIDVGRDALAHVTTGSATKVQSMTHNYAAFDETVTVDPGGHLDYVPEPTILGADARYYRDLSVEVAAGATAVLADVVVPGRLAHGERFDFERYLSRIRVRGPDGLLFADAAHLAPDPATSAGPDGSFTDSDRSGDGETGDRSPNTTGDPDPTAAGVMAEFPVYGTAFVVAPGTDAAVTSDAVHDVVADAPARAGATALPNDAGVAVRALGTGAEPVTETLRAAWDHARRELIDAPAPAGRKY